MTANDPTTGASANADGDDAFYAFVVQGHLGARWSAWFDGLSIHHHHDGTTTLRGPVTDQAALHGVLHKLRDIGLPLLSVTRQPAMTNESLTKEH